MMDERKLQRLVTPCYLQMMRLNALDSDAEPRAKVATVGRTTTADEVVALLRDVWRERVMGAWFALFRNEDSVAEAVLASLASSAGSLTSAPLAVVAVPLTDNGALDALGRYAAEDIVNQWGASDFAAAAIVHVGGTPNGCRATDRDAADFEALLKVARDLRWLG